MKHFYSSQRKELRFLWLVLLLLSVLQGCRTAATELPRTMRPSGTGKPTLTETERTTAPPQTASTEAETETTLTEPLEPKSQPEVPDAGSQDPEPQPSVPAPATDPPEPSPQIGFLAGDTTPTWDPAIAADYPADEDCFPALLLEKWMRTEGVTSADFDARDCDQLILVCAQPPDGVRTLTVCYERNEYGAFAPVDGLEQLSGHVGRNGIMHDRRRNSNTSPAGLWALGFAFGNELPPDDLKLPWRKVTPTSEWVCDEDSVYFNTWQERGDPMLSEDWSDDVEHLEDYPKQYAYACVIEFNTPPDAVPCRGCAIFLHCSEGATGGCVGLSRENLLAVLRWLDPEKHPYILITGTQVYQTETSPPSAGE